MTIIVIIAIAIIAAMAAGFAGRSIWKAMGGHRCQGPEIGRRFVPGLMDRSGKVWGDVDPELVYGYTEITYKCRTCGEFFNNRTVGRVND